MEKIILFIAGAQPAQHVLDFACYLSGITRSRLTGFFFRQQHVYDAPGIRPVYSIPYLDTVVLNDVQEYGRLGCSSGEKMYIVPISLFLMGSCSRRILRR